MNMIEVKTAELIGPVLDWAVATVDGEDVIVHGVGQYRYDKRGGIHCCKYGCTIGPRSITHDVPSYAPSTDWAQGGPLIEKYRLEIVFSGSRSEGWECVKNWCYAEVDDTYPVGETHLIAACRAIVEAKLGAVVSVPAELIGAAQ